MSLRQQNPFSTPAPFHLSTEFNPYVQKIKNALSENSLPLFVGETLKDKAGCWRQTLKAPEKKLVIEIGCHKGRTLLNLAQTLTQNIFLGIDITYKRVFYTAERIQKLGLTNAASILVNARFLNQIFAPGEADAILTFFPDPWSKKVGQRKHRLVNALFLGQVFQILKPSGLFCFKTDDLHYFTEVEEIALEKGFKRAPNSHSGEIFMSPITVFEEKFKQSNVKTYSQIFVKLA